jgi:capsular exopolysaccharide synthesis family protein
MNQDYSLSANPQPAGDFWTQNGSGILANAGIATPQPPIPVHPKQSPFRKAHRLLRGRYPAAIVLAAAGAIIGAVGGFTLMPAKYESSGLVDVNLIKDSAGPDSPIIPMAAMVIQRQVGLLSSTGVASSAMQDPNFVSAWQHAYGAAPMPTVVDFTQAITIEHKGPTPLITVSFDDKKKEVAEAGISAILHAYFNLAGSDDGFNSIGKTITFNENDLSEQEQKLTYEHTLLDNLSKQYGTTDLTVRQTAIQESIAKLEADLDQAKIALENAIAMRDGKAVKQNTDKEFIYEQIAAVDIYMARYLARREDARAAMSDLDARFIGHKNPVYISAQQHYADCDQAVADYAKEFLVRHQGQIPYQLDDGTQNNSVEILQGRVQSLEKMVAAQSKVANEIGQVAQQIADIRGDIALINQKRDSDLRTIEALKAQQALFTPVAIRNYGTEAVIAGDKRKLVAGLGFGFGGLIPLGLFMLYGMTENRFRYSDDASAADLSGVTLLGILPNLPDRLSDPQQAGIAAHCVHQIRTMLQISRNNDEPQVIAVTSASSGDGKTSLTLALGLSYAACGARTLLIDCDLIAAGLTHRLNVSSPDGVLESVANRALLEYVRTTDIADVAVLPVGTTHAHHASTLSPVALRRLISEAKKHFDLIIIDTGPILGSIEASLVCAAADRTILAVARNQQRPLVEKSIAHLRAIGAQLAGVVFNRAQASDFERSMSGLALRSRPLPGSMNTAEKKTAAATMAGSFKRAG